MTFSDLPALARHLREELEAKKFVLLYAYNGTGKTRLSTAFKDLGKRAVATPLTAESGEAIETETGEAIEVEAVQGDTLYFNAFTEDLFHWDNDLVNDRERVLKLNRDSRFFAGLAELEMDNRIRPLLSRYADFDFEIDTEAWEVRFAREVRARKEDGSFETQREEDIKISRGEENIFIWCFFLAVVQLAMDPDIEAYSWVKYVYIDDPISSLDEQNAIVVANHLVQLYRESAKDEAGELSASRLNVRTIISTHHNLFFNVLHYELKNYFKGMTSQYVLSRTRDSNQYEIRQQKGDTPSFHHVAVIVELDRVARGETIHTYHFNMLRTVLEKTALFHGYTHFGACIKRDADDVDGILHQRFVDLLSHGKYSLYEPEVMGDETKRYFRKIVREFLGRYPYNKALFPTEPIPEHTAA